MIVKLHQQYRKNIHDVSSIFSNHQDKEYISKKRQFYQFLPRKGVNSLLKYKNESSKVFISTAASVSMSPRIKGEAAHVYMVKRIHICLDQEVPPWICPTCKEALLLVTINDQSFKNEGLKNYVNLTLRFTLTFYFSVTINFHDSFF